MNMWYQAVTSQTHSSPRVCRLEGSQPTCLARRPQRQADGFSGPAGYYSRFHVNNKASSLPCSVTWT